MLTFKLLGIPQPKQSARFRSVTVGAKTFIKSYQKKEVIEAERNTAYDIKQQLPANFQPLKDAIAVKVSFVFPPPKSFPKKKILFISSGYPVYKITKPDLVDNLMKGLFDAMKGIVFIDDALICKTETEKKYGPIPMTIIEISTLPQ